TLESRVNPSPSSDILSTFNIGLQDLANLGPSVALQSMGANVPLVRQNFADQLKVADRLKQVLQAKVADPTAAMNAVADALRRKGWTVARMDTTPDATGRVLEVSKQIVVAYSTVSFDVGGTTGFQYFDD